MKEKTMLIVDDIEVNRGVLAECFCEDFSILQADGGRQAIRLIEKYGDEISVILLDIVMPDMDGLEVLKWLGASQYASVPVIAVTAEAGYQLEALENGAWDFIAKPEDNRVIRARVSNVLGRYALESERRHNEGITKAKLEMDNLVNSIPGGMCVYRIDQSGISPVVHNQAFFALFGYSAAHKKAVQKHTNYLNVHPEDLKGLQDEVNKAIQANQRINHTYRVFNDTENRYVWLNMNAVVVPQSDGTKLLYASYSDVTAEREAQEQLIQTQRVLEDMRQKAQDALDKYQLLVNTVPGGDCPV